MDTAGIIPTAPPVLLAFTLIPNDEAALLSPLHRLWRLLPARQRRAFLARATASLAPRPTLPPPPAHGGIAVVGELGQASGLGEGARLMLRGLASLGVPTWSIEPGSSARTSGPTPPDGVPLLLHVNAPQLPGALLRLPRHLVRGRRLIGHFAWELPVVPPDWRAGAGFVHEIWAPSRFTAAALRTLVTGRGIAVRVVPYPIAISPPVPARLGRADLGLPDAAVVVVVCFNLASSFERKNPLGAIAAFRQAFGARTDRLLVIKIINPGHFPADLHRLQQAVGDVSNIRLDTRLLPRADILALLACADIVLSLHRSEGFGLVPAEAMLLGRPVIATNWSGNTDFMTKRTAALVGYRLVPARDPRRVFEAAGAVWAEPDPAEAVAQLIRLADDAEARHELGERGRAGAASCLGTEKLSQALAANGMPTDALVAA